MTPRRDTFLSDGIAQAVQVLSPGGRPAGTSCFPAGVTRDNVKARSGYTPRDWLLRCVKDVLHGDESLCLVEDNLAVFALIEWRDGERLTYANIQVLRADATISEYCRDGGIKADYLRLDLDFGALGDIFTHPLPHVHDKPDGPPRFTFELPSSNIVVDFFDFVYRQFYHDKWVAWARQAWDDHYEKTITRAEEIDSNPFNIIVEAFKAAQYEALRDRQDQVQKLKRVLQSWKDQLFPLRLDAFASDLFRYQIQ
jgi:hypothetical protein